MKTHATLLLTMACGVMAAHADDPATDRLQQLERQLAEQSARLEQLRVAVGDQEAVIASLRDAVSEEILDRQRGGDGIGAGAPAATATAVAATMAAASPAPEPAIPPQPVGEAPRRETRAPEVARIFAEPTVLTRRGDFVAEPSLQSSYWASDRVALVGYTVIPAILIGLAAGVVCYLMVAKVKQLFGYDDALDAFGVHGIGGTLGAIMTGIFATKEVNDLRMGKPMGLVDGDAGQVVNQLIAVAISWGIAIVGTLIILKICDMVFGVRVSKEQETEGLDLSMHGEEGYNLES